MIDFEDFENNNHLRPYAAADVEINFLLINVG